ncbi:MAG: DNA replication/repair protein RecF [Hyphomicrobiales bacterium]|nr:DNA replication/repair protein RecF [Hyphomicrobiales bacterium]MCP5370128.1 DNA replication/repair protein RecF [Hyphomicrobiales bacterium]
MQRLTLTDFRCYRHLRLETDPRPVVLTGPNGAGKTNLLEAVSLLTPGRGLRRARLGDLARREPTPALEGAVPGDWAVAARLRLPTGDADVGTGMVAGDAAGRDKRAVRIDGQAAKGQAALAGLLAVQWLTPQMDRLFQDGAAERRRFLDRLVYGSDPAHAGRLSAYNHALRERARLLRDGRGDAAWLAALEETLAAKGVAVAAARHALVERLRIAAAAAGDGAFPGADLWLDGEVETWLADEPALAVEDRIRDRLAAGRPRDAEAGGAGVGPHRGDLRVRHLGKGQMAELCSTGEQKALLIAIVLAHARLVRAEQGRAPVLLLDEVAAHLDETRRRVLFDAVCALDGQSWLTGTDAAVFAPLGDRAQQFSVDDAVVTAARV